jgi:hypothetical protein
MRMRSFLHNGVIIIPPDGLKQLSCWYYQEQKFKNYELALVTCGVMAIPNFINFRPSSLQLRNGHRGKSIVKKLVGSQRKSLIINSSFQSNCMLGSRFNEETQMG